MSRFWTPFQLLVSLQSLIPHLVQEECVSGRRTAFPFAILNLSLPDILVTFCCSTVSLKEIGVVDKHGDLLAL